MKIIHEYPIKVFKNKYNDRTYYKIGLYKKDKNGNSVNGYLDASFRKDVELEDGKKIYIKDAWLDFYVKDKVTHLTIFINQFEYVKDVVENTKVEKDPFEEFAQEITDEDLPF